jgi:hypothetical protein
MGPDLFRLGVEAAEADVEVVEVVGDENVGVDRGGDVIPGLPLEGQRDLRGGGPGLFVENAIDLDRTGGFSDIEGRSPPGRLAGACPPGAGP